LGRNCVDLSDRLARCAKLAGVFDPFASLDRIGLPLALMLRLLSMWRQREDGPRAVARTITRRECKLAAALRVSLLDARISPPPLDAPALIAWVAKTAPFASSAAAAHRRLTAQPAQPARRSGADEAGCITLACSAIAGQSLRINGVSL
jgi:hypothetical protein